MVSRRRARTDKLIDKINEGIELVQGVESPFIGYDRVDKTAGTTVLDGYNRWTAQDASDIMHHTLVALPLNRSLDRPFGYASVDASSDGSTGGNLCRVNHDPINCALGDEDRQSLSWNGVPSVPNLSANNPHLCSADNVSDGPSLAYVAAVQKSTKAIQTTSQLGINQGNNGPSGSPQLDDDLPADKNLTAISAACTFFIRPDANDPSGGNLIRPDHAHEFASLYNPYWQARLAAPDPTVTPILYGMIGKAGYDTIAPDAVSATPPPPAPPVIPVDPIPAGPFL